MQRAATSSKATPPSPYVPSTSTQADSLWWQQQQRRNKLIKSAKVEGEGGCWGVYE